MSRSYVVTTKPAFGGNECPAPEKHSCNSHACCADKFTGWLGGGGGNSDFWDKHHVDCGANNVMTQWQLKRNNDNNDEIGFQYRCCDAAPDTECAPEAFTPDNNDGGNEVTHFDRHTIGEKCKNGQALKSWRLQPRGGKDVRFSYQCCGLNKLSSYQLANPHCSDHETGESDSGGGNSYFMDRHNIKCEDGRMLKKWHLKNNGKKMKIEYTCCS